MQHATQSRGVRRAPISLVFVNALYDPQLWPQNRSDSFQNKKAGITLLDSEVCGHFPKELGRIASMQAVHPDIVPAYPLHSLVSWFINVHHVFSLGAKPIGYPLFWSKLPRDHEAVNPESHLVRKVLGQLRATWSAELL